MKKLFTLFAAFAFTAITFAATETTVYYAVPSSVVGTYTVKLNVKLQGDADNWHQGVMTKTGNKFGEDDIYSCSYTDLYDGVAVMQFQLYNGETYISQQQPISSWTSAGDYNGKMYIHNKGWNVSELHGSWNDWGASSQFNDGNSNKVSITLAANKYYQFKVENVGIWRGYGYNTSYTTLTVLSNGQSGLTSEKSGDDNPNNLIIATTVAGEYEFSWDILTSTISVTYPTSYSRSDITEADIWGTICLPVDGEISNATLYSIEGKYNGKLYLTSAGTTLTAGMPYLFKSTAANPSVALANTAYEATPLSESQNTKGLYGRYNDQSFSTWDVSTIYVVRNHEIQRATTSSGVNANRAFIQLNDVPTLDSAPAAPAMHFAIDEENGATSIDAIEATEMAVKFVESGKLLIKKNGVVYDTTGRVVR